MVLDFELGHLGLLPPPPPQPSSGCGAAAAAQHGPAGSRKVAAAAAAAAGSPSPPPDASDVALFPSPSGGSSDAEEAPPLPPRQAGVGQPHGAAGAQAVPAPRVRRVLLGHSLGGACAALEVRPVCTCTTRAWLTT
jgi:hypothetical protein